MRDENGKPSRIIPIRDHQDPSGKRMTVREIKEEIIAGVAAASLAVGQKVYNQAMEQTTGLLEEMEHRLKQDYEAKIAELRKDLDSLTEDVHYPNHEEEA